MWLMTAALALAGLRVEADATARGSPDLAVACTSAREASTRAARFAEAADATVSVDGDPPPEAPRVVRLLADPRFVALAGDGTLRISLWRAPRAFVVGFQTADTEEHVARAWADLVGGVARPGPDAWVVDGAVPTTVRTDRGWARIVEGGAPSDSVRVVPAAMLQSLPEDPGCIALVHANDADLGDVDAGVHVPFQAGGAMHVAVVLAGAGLPPGMTPDPSAPASVRTPTVPDALLVVGFGLDDIDPAASMRGSALRKARRVQRLLPVTAGTTLAFFTEGPVPTWGAALPLERDLSPRAVTRRMRKAIRARAPDAEVRCPDATHCAAVFGATQVFFTGEKGRLLVTNDPVGLAAMEQGDGAPWVAPSAVKLARRYPFVVSSRLLPAGGGVVIRLRTPMVLALNLGPGLVTGVVRWDASTDDLAQLRADIAAARELQEMIVPATE